MRKYLLPAFGVAVDGLIGAVFGLEAFAAATGVLGLVCLYVFRAEILSARKLVSKKTRKSWASKNAARQNPGGGIHIAKLLAEAKCVEEADEIIDIFNDAPIKVNEGAVYAAYAAALVRFGDLVNAGGMLIDADRVEGMSKEELDAFMDRFYYPTEREEEEENGD